MCMYLRSATTHAVLQYPKNFFSNTPSKIYTSSLFTVNVFAVPGGNVTLPCSLLSKDTTHFGDVGSRIKWTKVADDEALNEDVLLSMGSHKRTYGSFENRAFLEREDDDYASIIITDVSSKDNGKYRCEIINGVSDVVQEVILVVQALGIYA